MGVCRIYVRRNSAAGAGHVGWAFEMANGKWSIGAVENPDGGPVADPGNTGMWSMVCEVGQVSDQFASRQYNSYRALGVSPSDFHRAQQMVAGWYQEPYQLVGKNCMDATYAILTAYGRALPSPGAYPAPNDWYDQIPTGEISIQNNSAWQLDTEGVVELTGDQLAAFRDMVRQEQAGVTPCAKAGRPVTLVEPVGARDVTWQWEATVRVSYHTITGAWYGVNIEGMRPHTLMFLHSWSGINTQIPKTLMSELQRAPGAALVGWVDIFMVVGKFLGFLGKVVNALHDTWEQFSKWFLDFTEDAPKQMNVDRPALNDKKNSVPPNLNPATPPDSLPQASANLIALQRGEPLSTYERGIGIFIETAAGKLYQLRSTPNVAATMCETTLYVEAALVVPDDAKTLWVRWLLPNDVTGGGDCYGVVDFWSRQ